MSPVIRLRLRKILAAQAVTAAMVVVALCLSPVPGHRPAPRRPGDPDAAGGGNWYRTVTGQSWYDRTFPRRTVPPDAYEKGIRQADSMARALQAEPWQELGPLYAPRANFANPLTKAATAVSGRVTALAVDPTTCTGTACGTIYLGAASGGVWKTTNAGQTWTALLDAQPDLAVGVITLDPRNPSIVYVGTGDPDHGSGSHRGIGILRSEDAGRSWTVLGHDDFSNRAVSSIIVDPRTAGNPNATLYATSTRATSGGAATGGGSSSSNPFLPSLGFYFSKDGGRQWTESNPTDAGADETGGLQAQGAVMDPRDPTILYGAFDWAGVYSSSDDGQTWTHLDNGLPETNFSIIRLAISQSNPQTLYAAFDASDGGDGPERLFRSDDAGASWNELGRTPNACGDQCFGNMHLAVDPSYPNVVYAGGTANYGYAFQEDKRCYTFTPLNTSCSTALMKSTDGGVLWTDISENGRNGPLHPDNHAILIDPANPQVVYEGGDGGIFHSSDGGASWEDLNKGLDTFQAQALSLSPTGDIYIGTQDNGTLEFRGSTTWRHVNDGDGGMTAADPFNPRVSYNTHYGANLFRNDHAGNPAQNVFIAPFWGDYDKAGRGQFYEPFSLAPSLPNDVFFGTYRVWRSEIRGGVDGNHDGDATDDRKDRIDWVPISFDLSCGRQPSRPTATCDSDANQGQGISAVAVSPVNPNVVAAATANGHIWLTHNALARVRTDRSCDPRRNADDVARCNYIGGVHWTRIDRGLPGRFPTSLHFGPGSSSTLYLTLSGFDENTPGKSGHVFESINAGRSWKDLSGSGSTAGLPDLPFNDIVVNTANRHLYACADYGVYVSVNGGRTWSIMDVGLPGVSVYQIQFEARGDMLVAATYGRGVWRVSAP